MGIGRALRPADIVIAMGCGGTSLIYPGKRGLDWDLPDRAGMPTEQDRPICDVISELDA
jgi:hypothetical protein